MANATKTTLRCFGYYKMSRDRCRLEKLSQTSKILKTWETAQNMCSKVQLCRHCRLIL